MLYLGAWYFSETSFDAGDGVRHHEIARYSWQHPELFLHHWGKPVFTLLCSPFAQFGIKGTMFFNILVSLITAALCIRTARKLGMPQPWLSAVLFLFAPVVYASSLSGLTEPLFALFLAAGVWLLLERKFITAALLLSFHPFVRSEGFVLLTVFQLFLLLEKKWLALAITLTGTIVYSAMGGIVYGDWLWLIHKSPYHFGENIYGRGDWHFFLSRNEFIYGIPFFVLTLMALLYGIIHGIKKPDRSLILLVLLPFSVYFLLHSVLWACGIQAGGMKRVMTGGMPLLAILAPSGLLLARLIRVQTIKIQLVGATLIALTGVIYPFKQFGFGFSYSDEEYALRETVQELQKRGLQKRKCFYLHPSFTLFAERDPFNTALCGEIWSLPSDHAAAGIREGELLIWDAHYAALEGLLKEEQVREDPSLELLFEKKSGSYSVMVLTPKPVSAPIK
ncbi:MAG: hypothetical protein IT233_00325 [Bacteroidia bacterium]|nr:hypothetical protein [Bacteroidia bacterium]